MKKCAENIYVQRSLPPMTEGASSELHLLFTPPCEGLSRIYKWSLIEGHQFDVIPDAFESYYHLYIIEGSLECQNSGDIIREDDCIVINNSPDYCALKALENTKILFFSVGEYKFAESYGVHSNLLEEYVFKINDIDRYTYGHSQRVKYLSLDLALYLNRSDVTLGALYFAALYHDAGKVYIPGEVLNYPGKLKEGDYRYILKHPLDSFMLIKEKMDPLTSEIVLQHHERFDGSGYPNGLTENDILIEAKIIAICDSFDAIRSKRVYSNEHTIRESLDILLEGEGVLYDADLLKAFESMVLDDEYLFPPIPMEHVVKFKAPTIRIIKTFDEERRLENRD